MMLRYLNLSLLLLLGSTTYGYKNHKLSIKYGSSKLISLDFSVSTNSEQTTIFKMQPLQAIRGPIRYSSNDWIECLATLPTSRILQRTKWAVLSNLLWTTLLVFIFKSKNIAFAFPSVVHSILGSALSLLLVFRTNSSYDRFWEARKLWSSIIYSSRELGRLTSLHVSKQHHERIANLVILFSIVLKQHLQGERVDMELEPFLEKSEVVTLQAYRNRPLKVLKSLSQEVFDAIAKDDHLPEMTDKIKIEHLFDHHISHLSSYLSSCERLVKQPIPLSYSRHTSRFLFMFMYSLPLMLIPYLGVWTIPTMTSTFWAFVSIQEIGHFIEEPFNKSIEILSLGQFIAVIRSDLAECLDGVVSSPDVEHFADTLLKTAKGRARWRTDNMFAYY